MNVLKYIKKNGIKRGFIVLYQYKIDLFLQKIMVFFLKKRPLEDIIIIESHNDFDTNGGAFYDYLIKNAYNQKYKIIWLVKNAVPKQLPYNVKAYSLYKPNLIKDYYICMAKFLTADSDVTQKARKDQKSFYFTHGAVGGKDAAGMQIVPESVDYVLSPSANYDEILSAQCSLPYPNGKMLHVGYPMNDVLYREIEDELKKITKVEFKKVFLWMPTFRKSKGYQRNDGGEKSLYGIPLIKNETMMEQLQLFLEEKEFLLIIKIHPMQDAGTYERLKNSKNIIILNGEDVKKLNVDNFRLMKSADALISDYSSVAYSYLLLNRPIGFVLEDLNEYKLGIIESDKIDFMVGKKIYNFDEFLNFLNEVNEGKDSYKQKRNELLEWVYENRDGNASERIVNFMKL